MAGVSIAEYFGQRTDIDTGTPIAPVGAGSICPFMGGKTCTKTKPFCSVRNSNGKLWISCKNRLCSSIKNYPDPTNNQRDIWLPLSQYQKNILLKIAQTAFSPGLMPSNVAVRREVPLRVNEGSNYSADFIMTINDGRSPYPGPDRAVLEMQGGGETSNTGKLTRHITGWEQNHERTNALLRREINSVGIIETNAWRRQQEQFFVKGNVSLMTWKGYGIIFCVGELLYDYIHRKIARTAILPPLKDNNWTLAFIEICEDNDNPAQPGPIPLKIGRTIFTNYQTFVHALINQGEPSLEAFAGDFERLDGTPVAIQRDGNVFP